MPLQNHVLTNPNLAGKQCRRSSLHALADLPAEKAREVMHVKVFAPALLTRATEEGRKARGEGSIIGPERPLTYPTRSVATAATG